MYFAEFWKRGLSGALISDVGDRSIFVLDGRNSLETMKEDARKFAKKYHVAFRLCRNNLLLPTPLTGLIDL